MIYLYMLKNRRKLSPLLKNETGQKPIFSKIFKLVRTIFLEKAQKKWPKAHFCKLKVGRKNDRHFLKTALFGPFLAVFGQFAQIYLCERVILPTCPLLFLINCDKKF